MRLVLAAFLILSVQASAQFWEASAGPPASTNCIASNAQGHVFAGTAYSAIYRSTDLGQSWVRLDKGIDDGGANFHSVDAIRIAEDGTLYACVKGYGLLRSKDNGDNWEKLPIGIEPSSSARISASLEKLPNGKTAVFVGYDAGRPDLFMYYSADGGDTFTEIPKSNLPSAMSSIFETFMSPNSDLMFVLVSYNKGLYRSSNMGGQWTRIDSDPNSGESDDNFLTMTANRNGVLYIGRNSLPGSTKSPNAVVMRSTNDGTSWEYLLEGWDNRDITNNRIRGIAFGPGDDVWAITEKSSGVFYSSNGGLNWTSKNDGLPSSGSGYGITVTPQNDVYVAPAGEFIHRHLTTSSVEEELPVTLRAGLAYPNPTRDRVSVDVTLDAPSTVQMVLTNVQGNQVLEPYDVVLGAGSHTLTLHTDALPAGMYAWRLIAGSQLQTGTFVIR